MASVSLRDVDLADVKATVGADSYARGAQYARQGAVRAAVWNPHNGVALGTVSGQRGRQYSAMARFSPTGFDHGNCSCPVGFDCKHVVALVLAVLERENPAVSRSLPASWERSLGSLLGTTSAAAEPTGVSLAIMLAVEEIGRVPGSRSGSGPSLQVTARPVRPGKNGGWVSGGLRWDSLENARYDSDYRASHMQFLSEFHAVYRSAQSLALRYSYGNGKSLDLGGFNSHLLWSMLDAADDIGVRLVHERARVGEVAKPAVAEFSLDVAADEDGALAVAPVLRVDEEDIDPAPIRFIGTDGHGLVYIDRADIARSTDHRDWRLRLARLREPVPRQLQDLAVGNNRLEIPAEAAARFRDEYYPRLRRVATVVSTDGTFTPPEIPEPTLVLRANYGDKHDLELDWEWAYQIGDSTRRASLDSPSDQGFRDLDAERAVLRDMDIAPEDLVPQRRLGGIDTMRFSTEVLPLLADRVTVEVSGSPVAYREAGDSLRIGVSADEAAGDTDWFDLGVTITLDGKPVPFAEVFAALCADESHMLLADGSYFSLHKPQLQTLRKLIDEARALQDVPGNQLKISRFQADLWDELAGLGVVTRQAKEWKRQVDGLLSIDSIAAKELPATFKATLRPYQTDGFAWLAFLWEAKLGGILADDMGLGKTLQSLALICHAKQTDPDLPPFLIVAPTSVVSNWATESARFAPDLNVVTIADTRAKSGISLADTIAGADVVVTSYTLFRLDFDAYTEQSWAGLLMDEAQAAKNHQSKIHQCARRFSAPFKLAITGTPMENNLMELWSLLSITAPGLFPNPTRFKDYYVRPIEAQADPELLAQLRRRIKPLVKRRTKEQVAADLPAKQEQILEVDLHAKHRKLYQTHLQRERQKVLGLLDDMDKNRFTILRSLTLLRQLSLHAGLIDDKHTTIPCAKLDALVEQIEDVTAGGHRALVFSQFTGFLAQVKARLDAEGLEYCYLDGKTRNRARVLEQFKTGSAPLFLISLKAGGFGLNLTEADYVFLLDPWWNPATEAQAVDRTHRIGQTRNVMVYRLIAKDTIEEKVMALKARKAELFSSVMDDSNAFGTTLNAEDIRGLFT